VALIIETGDLVDNSNSYVTDAEFVAWLDVNQFVFDGDIESTLRQSFVFLSALSWCDSQEAAYTVKESFKQAQMFLSYHIANGSFNPFTAVDPKFLKKKGLGRSAILKEWDVDKTYTGASPETLIKRLPMVYALLKNDLCGGDGVGNIELVR